MVYVIRVGISGSVAGVEVIASPRRALDVGV